MKDLKYAQLRTSKFVACFSSTSINKSLGTIFKSKSKQANLCAYATMNANVWHAKLGYHAPLILQKMLNNIHFTNKFHTPDYYD